MVRDSDSATEARSIVGCRSCRASPRRSRRFARAASVASRLEVFRSTRTPVAVIGRSLVAFPRPYTRSPSAMRIVRRRRRTRHRAIASRAFAREKVMRRRKTATATNTHLLGCHGGCHSTLAVRSLHVRVLLLSVRQDVARPSARRGVIFTGSKLGTNESKCSSSLSRSESAAAAALHSTRWWRRAPNFFNLRGALLLPRSVLVAPAGRSIAARRTERAHRPWGRRPARTTTWSRCAHPPASPPRHRADFVVCSRTANPAI